MATAASIDRPRYGSAAELARYGGVSPKTVRRLVGAGKVRGFRVGRRVVIRFEDFDRCLADRQEGPKMASAPAQASPHRSVDARGRALPMTEAEVRARAPAIARGLAELDAMGDEDEQRATLDALLAGLQAHPFALRDGGRPGG
jgi:excisionase family DNA binding protein